MDILIAHPLQEDVLEWLRDRHAVLYEPQIERHEDRLWSTLSKVRAAFLPASVVLDEGALHRAPHLRVIGRLGQIGLDDIERPACARLGVETVLGLAAHARSEAEFMLGALITLFRPGDDAPVGTTGRELGSLSVGLIGMSHTATLLATLLAAFRTRVVGYDPVVHPSDAGWSQWGIEPVSLRDMLERVDAVCVQLGAFSRYRGLLGERYLPHCRQGQVWVSVSSSRLFDTQTLAEQMRNGRIQSAWLDAVDGEDMAPSSPLQGLDGLIVTPRLAGNTQEAQVRRAWLVARQTHELLGSLPKGPRDFGTSVPADLLEGSALRRLARQEVEPLAATAPSPAADQALSAGVPAVPAPGPASH